MQPQQNQPMPPAQPVQPVQYVAQMENPGQTMAIIGLVLNFLSVFVAGIILGVISRNKSREAGMSTTLGTVCMVWGIIGTIGTALFIIFFIIVGIIAAANGETSSSYSLLQQNLL